ncbi:MAG: Uma2 family endonuclease [Anaerolineae bacterium]|nr:Uma2 family endonuclease [Anaerolineae bacterium]
MTDSPVKTPSVTSEEFEAFLALPENQDRRFELVHGEIVEKPMPGYLHQLISKILFLLLHNYADAHDLGEVLYEVRYRAHPEDTENDRIPDLTFTTKARVPAITSGVVMQIPDLCIEVLSPDDYPKQMRDNSAYYYLENGAKQVWVIYTKKPLIEVMYPDGQSDFYYPGDTLHGGDLLPGFEVALEEIFKVRD